jgi:hypothetical protein
MPRDLNVLAHKTLQIAIGEDVEPEPKPGKLKNPAAVALGKLGGPKGGKARWEGVSIKKRKELGRRAAQARWAKPRPKNAD